MARERKKLKFLPSNTITTNNIHYDTEDNLFADKHFGYYIMSTIPKSSAIKTPRRYIYFKLKKDFYIAKNKSQINSYSSVPIHGKSCILDTRMQHEKLILEIVQLVFKDRKSVKLTESLLIAISIVIDILDENSIILNTVNDFKTEHQLIVYNRMLKQKFFSNQDKRDVSRFFSEMSCLLDTFELVKPERYGFTIKRKTFKELTSSLMYQLEYYSLQELKYIKNKVTLYLSFTEQKDDILSKKNLLCTLIKGKEQNRSTKRIYTQLILYKLLIDYDIDGKVILKNRPNKRELLEIEKLRLLAENGVNLVKDEKFAVAWKKELFPYYPVNIELNEKYNEVTATLYARKCILNEFNISIEDIEEYLYPSKNTIYSLYLLLMIRTGLNSEVLLSWRLKNINNVYKLDCDDLGLISLVDSNKERSNSKITCVLKHDSDEMKFINFYINWCQKIYTLSDVNFLFQYFNRCSNKANKIEMLTTKALGYMKESPKSFFKKYEIFNEKNQRVDFIDHRLIRKSHNFQEYLKGKKEFERQVNKKHLDNKTTKNHYENNSIEWNGLKKHKIARSQNFLVSVFKGDVVRNENKLSKLFNGSMANCKNNKKPTYTNVPHLKENEYCLDWTKCLTSCEQACVIPKIHGPVIYAWIEYMNKQKEDFINENHWEKEYGLDYSAAIDTVKYFTEEEKNYCKLEMSKYIEFVKLVLKRTVKIGAIKSE